MDTDQTAGQGDATPAGRPEHAEAGPGASPLGTPAGGSGQLVGLVLVAHDPGEWFEDVLAAIGAQDQRGLDVLVVDAGRRAGLGERVEAILPWATVAEASADAGFGEAANLVLDGTADRQAFHLFLHDDVVLGGTAVRRLVECALETNAGVVGPKVLDGADPRHLEDMGAWIDRYGAAVPRFEPGELDQGQYDADREVFASAESALLVRADLFRAVGGYDPAIRFLDGALDLCWRARLVGASVFTAPTAVGRRVGGRRTRRRRVDPDRLRPRHKLRSTLVNQDPLHRGAAVAELLLATLLGAAYGLLVGRLRHVRGLVGAWPWNLRRLGSARARRSLVAGHFADARTHLYVRHDVPHRSFRRAVTGRASVGTGSEAPGRLRLHQLWSALLGPGGLSLLVGGAVLGFGSRHLLTRGLPAIGRYQGLPSRADDLVHAWWSGWRPTGTGVGAAPWEAHALMGLLAPLAPVGTGPLFAAAVLAAFPVGAVGVWRLVRPVGGWRSRAVAVLAYLVVPIPYNALLEGRLAPLAAYATLPWVAHRLALAQGVVPYGRRGGVPGPGTRLRSLWGEVLVAGVVVAVAVGVEPLVAVLAVVVLVGLVVGSLLAGSVAGLVRLMVVVVGACIVAGLLHLPILRRLLDGDPLGVLVAPEAWPPGEFGIWRLLSFDTGPFASGAAAALFVIPVVGLVTATGWRLALTARAWLVVAGSVAAAWAVDQGWWGRTAPAVELLLVPAALGLAWASAAGVAAIGSVRAQRGPGRRHVLSGLAGVALLVAALPVAGSSLDGRWGLPPRGLDSVVPLFPAASADPVRVLWLGEPSVLPAVGGPLDAGVAVAVTDGPPDLLDQVPFRFEDGEALGEVRDEVQAALEDRTSRLGERLGTWGIGHLVVVARGAPLPYAAVEPPAPERLLAALTRQLDLERVEGLNRAVTIFRNRAAEPVHAVVRDRTGRAVPVDATSSAWGRVEVTAIVDGAFRSLVGPSGAWRFEPREGSSLVQEDPVRGLPAARMSTGSSAELLLDDAARSAERRLQLVLGVVVVLATSWAHLGRARRGRGES